MLRVSIHWPLWLEFHGISATLCKCHTACFRFNLAKSYSLLCNLLAVPNGSGTVSHLAEKSPSGSYRCFLMVPDDDMFLVNEGIRTLVSIFPSLPLSLFLDWMCREPHKATLLSTWIITRLITCTVRFVSQSSTQHINKIWQNKRRIGFILLPDFAAKSYCQFGSSCDSKGGASDAEEWTLSMLHMARGEHSPQEPFHRPVG